MINKELYVPKFVKIISIKDETDLVKTFRVETKQKFKPGQFFQVSVLGTGEAPISISSSPKDKGFIELTVRNIGNVTNAIHKLKKGDLLGLRGPFGNSFPIENKNRKDLIFVAGGIGLAPLRPSIKYALNERKKYGRLILLYGAKTEDEIIFKNDLEKWQDTKDLEVLLTVDAAKKDWRQNIGVVTTLFDKVNFDGGDFVGFVCGPPIMMKFTINMLLKKGLNEDNIILTLERYMKCGVGKCGHCYLVDKYVCTDGPVFSYKQLKDLKPVEPLVV